MDEEELDLVTLYGVCTDCGAARMLTGDGSSPLVVCSAARDHVQTDTPLSPPSVRADEARRRAMEARERAESVSRRLERLEEGHPATPLDVARAARAAEGARQRQAEAAVEAARLGADAERTRRAADELAARAPGAGGEEDRPVRPEE